MSQEEIALSGSPLGGGEMIAEIVNILLSLASSRMGNARPSDAQAGEVWVDNSNDPVWSVKLYTGSVDLTLFTVNTSTEKAVVPVGAGGTGGNSVAEALQNLGLVIGTNVLAPNGDASELQNVPGNVISAQGGIIIGNADGEPAQLAFLANDKILGAVDGIPAWIDLPNFVAAVLGGIPTNSAEFTDDDTWTAPSGLLDGLALVEVQAGGAYGNAAYTFLDASNASRAVGASGGGSGRYILALVPVVAGNDYTVTVGDGGDLSASSAAGSSSFAALISCPAGLTNGNPGPAASVDSSVFVIMSQSEGGVKGAYPSVTGCGGSAPHGVGSSGIASGYGAGGCGNDGAPGRVRIWWNQ